MDKKGDNLPIIFLVCLTALISPLILIPIEKIFSYPYVIEEIVKAILIFQILKSSQRKNQLKITLIVAFFFALSENLFYSSNFIVDGILYSIWQRFLLTTILHILTGLIILLPSQKDRRFIFPATFLAMLVHFLYNQVILIILK